MATTTTTRQPKTDRDTDRIVEIRITATTTIWRRQLGPLPWAVLEELALNARLDQHGWIAPLGVRAIAAAVGVTKDTAARAVAVLRSAGLVTPDRLKARDGRSLSAYRLAVPDGVAVHICGPLPDAPPSGDASLSGVSPDWDQGRRVEQAYSEQRLARERKGIASRKARSQLRLSPVGQSTRRTGSEDPVQPVLFDADSSATGRTHEMSCVASASNSRPADGASRSQRLRRSGDCPDSGDDPGIPASRPPQQPSGLPRPSPTRGQHPDGGRAPSANSSQEVNDG